MNKRLILTLIILALCYMNVFQPILYDSFSYFKVFTEALNASSDELSTKWRLILMTPTAIIAILSILHFMEPGSPSITRNHLAIASIVGCIIYLLLFGLIYTAVILGDVAFGLIAIIFGGDYSAGNIGVGDLGWPPILYPVLFIAYVLVHRFMRYSTPEYLGPDPVKANSAVSDDDYID